jgi:hypothetical protein
MNFLNAAIALESLSYSFSLELFCNNVNRKINSAPRRLGDENFIELIEFHGISYVTDLCVELLIDGNTYGKYWLSKQLCMGGSSNITLVTDDFDIACIVHLELIFHKEGILLNEEIVSTNANPLSIRFLNFCKRWIPFLCVLLFYFMIAHTLGIIPNAKKEDMIVGYLPSVDGKLISQGNNITRCVGYSHRFCHIYSLHLQGETKLFL